MVSVEGSADVHGAVDVEDEHVALMVLDALVEEFGSPGRILPASKTKDVCKCVTVNTDEGDKKICTRPGILGTLTQEQIGIHCSKKVEVEDGRRERIAVMRATGACKRQVGDLTGGHQALDKWLDCVGEFLHREGVDVRHAVPRVG